MLLRRAPTILFAMLIAMAIVLGAFVFSARPALDRDRDRVDVRWTQLAPRLADRYESLSVAADRVREALGEDRTPLLAIRRDVARWKSLRIQGGSASVGQVLLANTLEGEAVRLQVLVTSTPRLTDAPPVKSALDAFAKTDVPQERRAYDDAVRTYEHARRGLARRLTASVLGYGARPTLEVPS